MERFIKHIAMVMLVSFAISLLLSFLSLKILRGSSFYKPSFVANLSVNQFDYVILGSSTGLTTLNSQAIDTITGLNGINLSMDDTAIASQYLMLKHFLASGHKTDYCILAPNNLSYNLKEEYLSDNDYRFLPFVHENYVKEHYDSFSDDCSNLLSASKFLPNLGMAYYNTELFYPSLISLISPNNRNRFDPYGNYTYPIRTDNLSPVLIKESLEIRFNNNSLMKLNQLCEDNGIELICYIVPMLKNSVKANSETYKVINHSDLLKNSNYFYDDIHVNSRGRQITSEKFSRDFKELMN